MGFVFLKSLIALWISTSILLGLGATFVHASTCAALFNTQTEKPREEVIAEAILSPRIQRLIRQVSGKDPAVARSIAEDLPSELYRVAVENWIYGDIYHFLTTYVRRRAASLAREHRSRREEPWPETDRELYENPRTPKPLDILVVRNLINTVIQEATSLSPMYQDLLVLNIVNRYVGREITQRDIAALLEIPLPTVKARLRNTVYPFLEAIQNGDSRPRPTKIDPSKIDELYRKLEFVEETLPSVLAFRAELETRRERGDEQVRELIHRDIEAARQTIAFRRIFVENEPALRVLEEMRDWDAEFLYDRMPAKAIRQEEELVGSN